MNGQLTLPMTSYQRPAGWVDISRRRIVKSDTVSRAQLLLFRLLERLCRRGKPGMVRNIEKIVEMLGDYSERSVWRYWKALVTLRWIDYRIFRKNGKQYIEFWVLVRVEQPKERIFVRRKVAPSVAPTTPQNGTLAPLSTDSSEPSEARDDERAGSGVVVPPPSAPSLEVEALEALRGIGVPPTVAGKIAVLAPTKTILKACQVVSGILSKKGGNPIALAYSAVRGNWDLPLPAATHASDRRERPVRVVRDPNPPAPPVVTQAQNSPEERSSSLDLSVLPGNMAEELERRRAARAAKARLL